MKTRVERFFLLLAVIFLVVLYFAGGKGFTGSVILAGSEVDVSGGEFFLVVLVLVIAAVALLVSRFSHEAYKSASKVGSGRNRANLRKMSWGLNFE